MHDREENAKKKRKNDVQFEVPGPLALPSILYSKKNTKKSKNLAFLKGNVRDVI